MGIFQPAMLVYQRVTSIETNKFSIVKEESFPQGFRGEQKEQNILHPFIPIDPLFGCQIFQVYQVCFWVVFWGAQISDPTGGFRYMFFFNWMTKYIRWQVVAQ